MPGREYTLKELSNFLDLHDSTISLIAKQMDDNQMPRAKALPPTACNTTCIFRRTEEGAAALRPQAASEEEDQEE